MIAGATSIASGTTLTIFGSFSGSGTLSSGGSNAALSLQGTAGNMGTINLTAGAQTFTTLTVNIGGATPQVSIIGNLTISTLYTMTSGVVNMGPYSVIYSVATTTPMLIANQNSSSYFTFLGASSGLQWNMSGIASGTTCRWNVGPAGIVNGWRPVTIQTVQSTTSNVKIGFVNLDGTGTYSASNIPNSGGNVNANYIANLTVSGAGIGTPNVTMEYQDADFNTTASAASNVNIWYYNMPPSGTSIWTSTGTQTSNGTNGANTTIVKNAALALTAGVYPLNLAETNNDAGTANNTWVWQGGSTSWNVASNWLPASVPGTGANIGVNVLIPQRTSQPNMDVVASIGDITVNSGAILTLTTTNTLTVAGNFYNNGTLTYSTTGSTVTYTGTGKLIAPGTYYNLTASGATTPVLSSFGTIAIANTFTPGAAVYTYTGSTITFTGTTQNIPAFAYFNNVNFNATTSNTLTGAISVFGNMFIGAGGITTFNDGGFVITGPGSGSGIFTLAASKVYTSTTTGTNALPIFQTYVIDPSSTVNLNGSITATQNIPAAAYGIMVVTNGGTNAKTALGNMTIKGNLTVTSGTLNDGGFTITACGNVTNNAITGTNGSITSTGSGKLLLSAGTASHTVTTATPGTVAFGNLELNDAAGATLNNGTGATNVTGTLTVSSGNLNIASFTSSLNVSGATTVAGSGTLTITVVAGTKTFGDVTINGVWNNSINGPVTISGNFTNNGSFASGSGANTLSGAAKSINGTSPTTFTSLNVTGTYTNNITSASGGV
ncbi:MAG: hypothetical protein ABI855_15355, partial [Bacteroidota bacterium]